MAPNLTPSSVFFALLLICLLVTTFTKRCKCPCEIARANILGATYTSPNYPSSYYANLTCNYEIVPRKNWAVALEVDHLDIDEQEDFLEISQTANDQNGQLHRVAGTRLSGNASVQRVFYSSIGGGFHLFFKSNSQAKNFAGFKASFNRIRTGINITDVDVGILLRYKFLSGASLSNAIQSINDAHGSILVSSETAAEWYARFELGEMAIDGCEFNKTISLSYSQGSPRAYACPPPLHVADATLRRLPALAGNFPTHVTCAFQINSTGKGVSIEIRDLTHGTTLEFKDQKLFKRFIGSTQFPPVPQFDSRTPSVTVLMTVAQGADYDVRFTSGPSICACPTELIELEDDESRTLTSPGFPLDYCDLADCETLVRILPSNFHNDRTKPVVRVTVHSFHVEENHDYLEMIAATSLISLTGAANSIRHFTFDQSNVNLRFVTNDVATRAGFNLSVESYEKPRQCVCPGSQASVNDSTHRSEQYAYDEECGYMDCFWTIPTYSQSYRKATLFIDYRIFAPTEFIEVSNGTIAGKRIRMDASADGLVRREVNFEDVDRVIIWYHREDDLKGGERTIKFEYRWN